MTSNTLSSSKVISSLKLKKTIQKTKSALGSSVETLLLGKKQIDEETLEEMYSRPSIFLSIPFEKKSSYKLRYYYTARVATLCFMVSTSRRGASRAEGPRAMSEAKRTRNSTNIIATISTERQLHHTQHTQPHSKV